MKMKKLIMAVLAIALFSGCAAFRYFDQAEKCKDLLEQSKEQNIQAEVIIDSLVIDNMRYKEKLDSCQASKIGNRRTPSF